jgi:hypothetical protein
VRRVVLGFVVLLGATGCQRTLATPPETSAAGVQRHASPSAFTEVTAGPVRAVIPDEWDAVPAGGAGAVESGLFASPEPEAFARGDGSVAGLAATWVDATIVGVPSDYYYAAAKPMVAGLTNSQECSASHRVIVDNRPSWMAGAASSPGDYLVRGRGTCEVSRVPTRWAYFVAAPGFGAERAIGIPSSGLYVVVAVLPATTPRATGLLRKLLTETSFGGAGIRDFVVAARGFPETEPIT